MPLGYRREERAEVEALVRRDLIAIGRELAAEGEDGAPIEVRVRDAGHEVRRSRAEGADAHADAAARRRGRLGHECRRGLVLGEHELEPGLPEALDELDDLATGMSEHVADAGRAQPIADRAGDRGTHRNRMPPLWEGRAP